MVCERKAGSNLRLNFLLITILLLTMFVAGCGSEKKTHLGRVMTVLLSLCRRHRSESDCDQAGAARIFDSQLHGDTVCVGVGDKVVGVDDYSNYPAAALK